LTFSGVDESATTTIANYFKSEYINTIVNKDVIGVQYAGVAKNIYALGAGIAHGLEYGDNFLSVFIANCANEMQLLLCKIMDQQGTSCSSINHNASVYLGDLLVTCYSLHSRNRTFGNMIGKGYTVRAAELELNMVAEGYYATDSVYNLNKELGVYMPLLDAVYAVVYGQQPATSVWQRFSQEMG
jgi:glycerol-3-phosphate dehydrogenase (NAD(P)+)